MVTLKRIEVGKAGLLGLRAVTDKLNRRAVRHDMNMLSVRVVREFTVRNEDTGIDELRFEVEINGCAPCIDGWHLAAKIENNDTIGTMVKVVPGVYADDDYSSYRGHDYSCDHCKTSRRRNDVFVLKRFDGSVKVVGRNCLADFLRCADAEHFADYAEMCDSLAGMGCDDFEARGYDEGFGGRNAAAAESLVRYLTAVRCVTRRMGWMSRTTARNSFDGCMSTADNANFMLYGKGEHHRKFVYQNELFVSDADRAYAEAAVEWAKSLSTEETAKSEYLNIIHRIATVGLVGDGLDGYAASIGCAKDKADEREAEYAKSKADAPDKVYLGCVGERLRNQVVMVVRVRYCDGNYGVSTIVAMEAKLQGGSVAPITWFASGEHNYDEGAEYKLTGTVKAHDDDNRYGRQTKMNRCKLEKV